MKEKKETEVVFITPCDYALTSQDGKSSILGIFDWIAVSKIPTVPNSFYIYSMIKGKPNSKHTINLEIFKPSKSSLGLSPSTNITLGENGRANFISRFDGILIDEIGDYDFVIKIDEKKVGSTKINIRESGTNGRIQGRG